MQATYVSTPGMEAAGINSGQTLTARPLVMPLGLALAWTPMGTESLSEDIIMMELERMQATHVSTLGMEAAGVSWAVTLMVRPLMIILVILCP